MSRQGKSDPAGTVASATEAVPTYQRGPLKALWYWMSSTALWTNFWLLYGLRRSGQDNVPMQGPVVLLANHTSHLDPPLVGGATRRQLSFLARDTLFVGPFGWLIRSYDAVPVDRDGASLAGIRATLKRLKQGGAVLLFPEGTRSPDGTLQPFKPGFIALVRRSGAAIVPIGIAGADQAWPKGASRPRLSGRIAMSYGEPIPPAEIAQLDDPALLSRCQADVAANTDAARGLRKA